LRQASVVEAVHKLTILAKTYMKRIEGKSTYGTTLKLIRCIVSGDGYIKNDTSRATSVRRDPVIALVAMPEPPLILTVRKDHERIIFTGTYQERLMIKQ